MDYEEIKYEVADRVLTITLYRPDKLNAFTARMGRELIDAFDRADADDAVRAIVVTGAGRAFCAGADLSSGGDTFDYSGPRHRASVDEHRDGGGLVTLRIFDVKKPVIAAFNGPAVGVGILDGQRGVELAEDRLAIFQRERADLGGEEIAGRARQGRIERHHEVRQPIGGQATVQHRLPPRMPVEPHHRVGAVEGQQLQRRRRREHQPRSLGISSVWYGFFRTDHTSTIPFSKAV